MPLVKLNDVNLFYELHGSGFPLLFIHGFPLYRGLWENQWKDLSDAARIIAPDLRGHGDSESDHLSAYSMQVFAQDCFDLLEALRIPFPIIVCGLSMGGYIAMAMLRLFPNRIAGLILTATRASADSPEAKANRDQSIRLAQVQGASPITDSMLPRLLSPKNFANRPDLVEKVLAIMAPVPTSTIIKDLQGLKERPDSTDLLAASTLPTLLIHGADDQIVPLVEAQTLQETIPNAQLIVLPNAGHLPNLEQPVLFNNAVRQFIKRVTGE